LVIIQFWGASKHPGGKFNYRQGGAVQFKSGAFAFCIANLKLLFKLTKKAAPEKASN
jgi:hypothetical protein